MSDTPLTLAEVAAQLEAWAAKDEADAPGEGRGYDDHLRGRAEGFRSALALLRRGDAPELT